MEVVSITGYFGTGSSAVTDYIREFENIKYVESELHLLMSNGGLDELNYKWSLGNPYLVGLAIDRFLRCAEILSKIGIYSLPFDDKRLWNGYFIKRTKEFIEEITTSDTEIFTPFNLVDKRQKFNNWTVKTLPKIKRNIYKYIFLKSKMRDEFSYGKDKFFFVKSYSIFLQAQKRYIKDLLKNLQQENRILVLDHFIPSNLIQREDLYIQEMKYIVVDRDPRDIYILNLEKYNEAFVPKNIYEFINWYKLSRMNKLKENDRLLLLKFEDLIYKNNEVTNKIRKFLNLKKEEQIYPKKYLDIEKSIKNTQLFKRYLQYEKEINIIEKELKEYCYNFPDIIIEKGEIF